MSQFEASSLDALWEELSPHVEWPEGFGLVLLFAGHPGPVLELRRRVETVMGAREKAVRVVEPVSVEEVAGVVQRVLQPEEQDGAVWVSFLKNAGVEGWAEATQWTLKWLNERRFLLERDVGVPMVMVLPLEFRDRMYVIAPDLWTVRSFVGVVPAPEVSRGRVSEGIESRPSSMMKGDGESSGFVQAKPGLAEREWARLVDREDRRSVNPSDGFLAFEQALKRGDVGAARRIAFETFELISSPTQRWIGEYGLEHILAAMDSLEKRQRRFASIALENLGRVEMDSGNLQAARSLFQRSVDVSQSLADADPHSAQAQRDLSVALNYLGSVERDSGNLQAARSLFQHALSIAERLHELDPHSAQVTFDLVQLLADLSTVTDEPNDYRARALSLLREMNANGQVEGYPERERLLRELTEALDPT